jgi:hypothetical protein
MSGIHAIKAAYLLLGIDTKTKQIYKLIEVGNDGTVTAKVYVRILTKSQISSATNLNLMLMIQLRLATMVGRHPASRPNGRIFGITRNQNPSCTHA